MSSSLFVCRTRMRSRAKRPAMSSGRASVDRKSTRLNSSHSQISYAVFCLKKKKHKNDIDHQHRLPGQPVLTERFGLANDESAHQWGREASQAADHNDDEDRDQEADAHTRR